MFSTTKEEDLLSPKPEDLSKIIKQSKDDWELSECVYFKCRDALRETDLCQITVRDVRRQIRAFLQTWGNMGRVLNEKRYPKWEEELAKAIRENCRLLNDFRVKKLANIKEEDLESLKIDVEKCYEIVRKQVAPTSASKVLHLIAPDFFPMWDGGIRKKLAIRRANAEDYWEFMKKIKRSIENEKYNGILNRFSADDDKSILKLFDEYLYVRSRNKPS